MAKLVGVHHITHDLLLCEPRLIHHDAVEDGVPEGDALPMRLFLGSCKFQGATQECGQRHCSSNAGNMIMHWTFCSCLPIRVYGTNLTLSCCSHQGTGHSSGTLRLRACLQAVVRRHNVQLVLGHIPVATLEVQRRPPASRPNSVATLTSTVLQADLVHVAPGCRTFSN